MTQSGILKVALMPFCVSQAPQAVSQCVIANFFKGIHTVE